MIRTWKDVFRELLKNKVGETILRKLVKNKSSRSLISRLVPNHYQYKKNSLRKFSWKDVILEGDISDYMIHALYFGFKQLSWDEWESHLGKDFVVIDVGAHIGALSIYLAKHIVTNGWVYAFEADPVNFQALIRHVAQNNVFNIRCFNNAISDVDGKQVSIIHSFSNSGGSRIVKDIKDKDNVGMGSYNDIHKVITISIDTFVYSNKLKRVDAIKIDVEGYETNVLRGALQTIQEYKPVLMVEINDKNLRQFGSSEYELRKLLSTLGYKVVSVIGTKEHYDLIARFI